MALGYLTTADKRRKWPRGPRVPPHSSVHTAQCDPYLVKPEDILDEESVRIVPWEQHILEDIPHAFLLKAEVFCPHYRGIDQIQPGRSRTFTKQSDTDGKPSIPAVTVRRQAF